MLRMGISRYPRPGQKISPELLAPVLDVPIPWRLLNQTDSAEGLLCDLDETTWERLSPNVCAKLGAAVVREISSRIASLPDEILGKRLPVPEFWAKLADAGLDGLELEARTYNCLVSEGLLEAPGKLQYLTVKDLLEIRSFGAKSLVDLLAALESLHEQVGLTATVNGTMPALRPRVSRFPRPGNRLAPRALDEILNGPIPTTFRRRHEIDKETFAELDESVWESLDTQVITKLGELVVAEVDQHLPSLPPNVLYMKLPLPADGSGLQDLELERRTYNCLQRDGLLDDPARLYEFTIGGLLRLRGIGGKSLVDFLCAIEHCHPPQIQDTELRPDGHIETKTIAKRMREQVGRLFIGRDDPRLGTPLRMIDSKASQLDEILAGIESDRYSEIQLRAMSPGMTELESRLQVCAGRTLIEELAEITTVGLSARDADIVGHYFGWKGSGPQTLKQIGERFGLTRERVRQIGVEQAQRLEAARPFAPLFLNAVERLTARLPLSEIRMAEVLGEGGRSLSLRALQQIGELFGVTLPFTVVEVGQRALAVPADQVSAVDPIAKQARRLVDQWGLGTLDEVAAIVTEEVRVPVDRTLAEAALEGMDGIAWLSDDRSWFLIDDFQKNKLERQVVKILSVSPRVQIGSLREGLLRSFKRRELAPPSQVVARFLAYRGFDVIDETVSPRQPIATADVLSASEETMVEILRQSGPQLRLDQFEELCLRRGVKKPTYVSRIDQSPLFVVTRSGLIGLRGVTPEPERAVATTVAEDPQTDGIIVASVLDASSITRGSIPLPPPASTVVTGSFPLSLGDGSPVGRAVIENGEVNGLGPIFSRRGGIPGDIVVLEILPSRRRVVAWLGIPTE